MMIMQTTAHNGPIVNCGVWIKSEISVFSNGHKWSEMLCMLEITVRIGIAETGNNLIMIMILIFNIISETFMLSLWRT